MLDAASVTLFVGDAADLVQYLPVVKRWLQADLLGFNADCDDAALVQACELATRIEPTLTAYVTNTSAAAAAAISVPDLAAAPIPIDQFTQ